MSTNVAQIIHPAISVKPSKKLEEYLSKVKVTKDVSFGINNFTFKNKGGKIITLTDEESMNSNFSGSIPDLFTSLPFNVTSAGSRDKLLSLQDLHWLYEYIKKENNQNEKKVYLHELIEGSHIILPKNQAVLRNPDLELRCCKLRAEQCNRIYCKMTKNVDTFGKKYADDNLGYQIKQLDKYLVAIFQIILSVAAGFVLGFVGVELITGSLDFGFRLLLGIVCASAIALSELYFLVKKLNEELQFEFSTEQQQKSVTGKLN